MRTRTIDRAQCGLALVVVLWAAALLSVIAASFAFSMRVETRLAGNQIERTQAQAIADAGIRRGILALLGNLPETRWVADGRAYELPFGDAGMRIRLFSENGKVDLNGAPEALIHGLLAALVENGDLADEQQATAIADAILDWRDTDQRPHSNGAEDRHYQASGYPYGARDGAFLSVAELGQILGMDAAAYARLAPLVTVYSWAPQVDPMTAPRQVLLGIPGLDGDQVEAFLAARNAFYASRANGETGASRLPSELLSAGARYLSRSTSNIYMIDSVAELFDGTRATRRAVIQLTGDHRKPYLIVAWFDTIPDAEDRGDSLNRR